MKMKLTHLILTGVWCGLVVGASFKTGAAEPNTLTDAEKKAGWCLLFDGQTLAGWKASEDPASFSVRDGMIVAHARGTPIQGQAPHPKCHLFYIGPDGHAAFTDFEFQADVKTEPDSNGGLYFHTEFVANAWPQKGFEIQINNTKQEKRKTGSLYAVADVTEALVRDNEWFHLHIIVRGQRVVIKLDGQTVVDWTEPAGFVVRHPPWFSERKLSRGTFALQAHDAKSVVYFKNLRVRSLDEPPTTGPLRQRGDITTGLVSHWTLDEGTGKVAKDRISGNHGVFEKGEPAWVKGKIGKGALEFSESCFLNCGKHESLNMTKAMTFAAWIKKTKDGRKSRIASKHGFGKESAEKNAGWLVLCGGAQKVNIEWRISTTGEDWHGGFTTPKSFPYDQWNHLAVTYDGAVMRAYINGVEDTGGDFPCKVSGLIHLSSAETLLGQDRAHGQVFGGPKTWSLTGTMDDARLYHRALSAEDVKALVAHRGEPLNEPVAGESWVNPPKEPIPGVEHRVFQSASMQHAVGFNLYLPPGYAGSEKRFPVVYYLHGMTDCESTHPQLFTILEQAIRAGEAPPMILVYTMCGRTSFYADSPDGEVMGETVFIKELIPHVDRTVRTIASRDGRAVMGFSMGGAGALKFACKYPDLFSSAVSFSGGFTTGEFEKPRHPAVFKKMFADDVKRFDEQSALTLARTGGGKVPLRLAVGTKDFLLEHNRKMKAVLEDLKVSFECEEIEGVAHNPPLVFAAQGLQAFQFHARHFRP